MNSKVGLREAFLFAAVCIFCFAGGIMNGIIGTGSGILFMLCATLIRKFTSVECDMYALSMSCVLPVSVFSFMFYPSGTADAEFILNMLIPAISGGIMGAYIKGKVKTEWLSYAFAALTVYSGISMIMRSI